jgi:uncharacterized glyoxalase superfamily protein PhnB
MSPPRARFGGIDVVSANMQQSLDFYRAIGVDIPEDKVFAQDGAPQHVDVKTSDDGSVGIDIDSDTLTAGYDSAWSVGRAGVVAMFRTDTSEDVDALHDHLVSLGHPSHMAPIDAFWGARYAIVEDPDGNLVSLMGPMTERS